MKKFIILMAMVLLMVPSIGLAKDFDFALTAGVGPGQAWENGNQVILLNRRPHWDSRRLRYRVMPLEAKDTSPVYVISGQVIYNGKGLPEIFSILKLTGEINYRWASYNLHTPSSGDEMNPWYLSIMAGITKNFHYLDGYLLAGYTHHEAGIKVVDYKPRYLKHTGTPGSNLFTYKLGFYKLFSLGKGFKIGPELSAQGWNQAPGVDRCRKVKEWIIQPTLSLRLQY